MSVAKKYCVVVGLVTTAKHAHNVTIASRAVKCNLVRFCYVLVRSAAKHIQDSGGACALSCTVREREHATDCVRLVLRGFDNVADTGTDYAPVLAFAR